MSYFKEIDSYETYANNEDDFHFIYNANSGGGQSFFGGRFRDANGNLVSPTSLNNRIGQFRFKIVHGDEIHDVSLADPSVRYEIKPRANGSNSMKLSVGNKPNPSAVITTFLMLPETCGVKKTENINTSVLSKNNYWLQSMWLSVEIIDENNVFLIPRDCVIGGGVDESGRGSIKYFAINYSDRISDVIKLADNDTLDSDIAICIKHFAEIYKGAKNFLYNESVDVIKTLMKVLSEKYPDRYSGTLDPITFIKEITHSQGHRMKPNSQFPYTLILFGAPGTGKSHKLNDDALIFENQTRIILEKTKDENVIKDEVAKAIVAPKGRKLTSLNAIGFKYADFWKERTHLSKPEIRSFCNYQKISEIYLGAVAKFILDADVLKMSEEELSDIAYIKTLLHDDEKRGENDKLKWANAIGYKMGEADDYANLSLKDIETDLGLKGAQVWWLYRGIQAARLKEDEESISEEPFVERVTFHPNYSFAQFVGTYKPVQDDEDEKQIKYEYVPGPFMRVYRNAKKNPNNDFLLIIEEINRANVAAVFGDVFQLLDRKNGISEYPVAASEDIQKYLAKYGINERKLSIPDNMYIWATMNSADQGVFPMDTAFKRRWEFEYIGIDENEDGIKDYDVPLQKKEDGSHEWVKWNDLRHSINDKLTEMKINEDKLLGPYFISEEKLKLVEGKKEEKADEFVKSFKSKVLMYLFEDAVKMRPGDLFDENAVGRLRFSDICKKFDEIGQGIFNFKK